MTAVEGALPDVRLDAATKGIPALAEPVALDAVGGLGWTLDDLHPPVLVLRRSALEHNLALMADYCATAGVGLAPHGKTTMAPGLWRMQLGAGAWGITAATAVQARIMRAAGVPRILIANELTDERSVRWAAADLDDPSAELVCYVDSAAGVRLLDAGLRDAGAPRPLRVLVELGHPGGRTGCRDSDEAIEIADAVASSSSLELGGLAGYEGTIAHDREPASLAAVAAYLDGVAALADRLVGRGLVGPGGLVTAGGSLFFDLVAERLGGLGAAAGLLVLLRSGCYLTHDAGLYERSSPFAGEAPDRRFRSALEAWGTVLSRPEPELALLALGRRDVPYDQGFPRPMAVRRGGREQDLDGRVQVSDLNDQHAFCRVGPDVRLEVGDLVRCGISHPCSAFDRWRVIPVLDDADRVVDAVATYF
jgi:D-serine deaminase-like pyridoxal phosphate-dependent protein